MNSLLNEVKAMENRRDEAEGMAGLPSRREKHASKKAEIRRKLLFFAGRAQEEEAPEKAFYEALQTVREQASASATPGSPVLQGYQVRRPWYQSRVMLAALLAFSIIGNLGQGLLMYKLLRMYDAEKNRHQAPQEAKVNKVQSEPEVSEVRQAIAWSDAQRDVLPRDVRSRLEERLSKLVTPDLFAGGSFNFVHVVGLNQFALTHQGGVALSAFFQNGFLRSYEPTAMRVTLSYDGRVVLEKTLNRKFGEWVPGEVYLIDLEIGPDDVRDAKLLQALLANKEEQAKMKFEVAVAYYRFLMVKPEYKEEVWAPLKTRTLVESR
jgi:hypothetical protein